MELVRYGEREGVFGSPEIGVELFQEFVVAAGVLDEVVEDGGNSDGAMHTC